MARKLGDNALVTVIIDEGLRDAVAATQKILAAKPSHAKPIRTTNRDFAFREAVGRMMFAAAERGKAKRAKQAAKA